CAQDKQLPSTF
nr:immunoglobulin light chain junction region [Macaca mulatta]MOX25110.1 immunoglobulin light chain junction region [Macaca mulatta]MOX25140.1 immunoglobulin light chain junction region [Macaca mulatta]MOX25757.1 immunoglobulin light chain junction region [Macaca mulatta]MOX26053.1 immunoglobulin light chain junction region [Macaca mulatta]